MIRPLVDIEPRVLSVAGWLPLDHAALCLNGDETVFDVSGGQCPTCASENFMLLATWLQRRLNK